jgi:hypothetical protein
MQMLRHGKLTPEREHGRSEPCGAPDCPSKSCIRGYCRKHARQVELYGKLTPDREYQLGVTQCTELGCSGAVRAKGRCAKHYNQAWRVSASEDIQQ